MEDAMEEEVEVPNGVEHESERASPASDGGRKEEAFEGRGEGWEEDDRVEGGCR